MTGCAGQTTQRDPNITMPNLNWDMLLSDIGYARGQLQQIEQRVAEGSVPSEHELKIMLEHAYKHLNDAWEVCHAPTQRPAPIAPRLR